MWIYYLIRPQIIINIEEVIILSMKKKSTRILHFSIWFYVDKINVEKYEFECVIV